MMLKMLRREKDSILVAECLGPTAAAFGAAADLPVDLLKKLIAAGALMES